MSQSSNAVLVLCVMAAMGSACRKAQTFDEAIREACEFPERPDVCAAAEKVPPADRAAFLSGEFEKRITNPEAKLLFSNMKSDEFKAVMTSAVKRAGLTRCWLTDPPALRRDAGCF